MTTRIWDSKTLNGILAQFRKLGATVKRDNSTQTVIVTGAKGKEALGAMKSPAGWIAIYDDRLISERPKKE